MAEGRRLLPRSPRRGTRSADEVLPDIIGRPGDAPIRVWSAACASGQEAYSAVMLLAEELGAEAVRERVKVYATDIDTEGLEQARVAAYSPRDAEGVPAELLAKYFDETAAGFQVKPDLRRCVIFGRHDLLQDAPISRV